MSPSSWILASVPLLAPVLLLHACLSDHGDRMLQRYWFEVHTVTGHWVLTLALLATPEVPCDGAVFEAFQYWALGAPLVYGLPWAVRPPWVPPWMAVRGLTTLVWLVLVLFVTFFGSPLVVHCTLGLVWLFGACLFWGTMCPDDLYAFRSGGFFVVASVILAMLRLVFSVLYALDILEAGRPPMLDLCLAVAVMTCQWWSLPKSTWTPVMRPVLTSPEVLPAPTTAATGNDPFVLHLDEPTTHIPEEEEEQSL